MDIKLGITESINKTSLSASQMFIAYPTLCHSGRDCRNLPCQEGSKKQILGMGTAKAAHLYPAYFPMENHFFPQINANERKSVGIGPPSSTALHPIEFICVYLRSLAAKFSGKIRFLDVIGRREHPCSIAGGGIALRPDIRPAPAAISQRPAPAFSAPCRRHRCRCDRMEWPFPCSPWFPPSPRVSLSSAAALGGRPSHSSSGSAW